MNKKNCEPQSSVFAEPSNGHAWVAHYERLRNDVLTATGGQVSPGLAVFLHKGMAAWMQMWLFVAQPTGHKDKPTETTSRISGESDLALHAGVRAQITSILAEMIVIAAVGGAPAPDASGVASCAQVAPNRPIANRRN